MDIKEPSIIHHYKGMIEGKGVKKYEKLYKDIMGIYESKDAKLAEDTLMYEVYSCEEGEPSVENLYWGLSILHPVLVNGECNMTRGHFHQNLRCNEFYYGATGEGLLMLMDENGKESSEKVFEGSLHNIRGTAAHRLINIGNEPLRVIAAWSSGAGHDYERIEENPFTTRVFMENGCVKLK